MIITIKVFKKRIYECQEINKAWQLFFLNIIRNRRLHFRLVQKTKAFYFASIFNATYNLHPSVSNFKIIYFMHTMKLLQLPTSQHIKCSLFKFKELGCVFVYVKLSLWLYILYFIWNITNINDPQIIFH